MSNTNLVSVITLVQTQANMQFSVKRIPLTQPVIKLFIPSVKWKKKVKMGVSTTQKCIQLPFEAISLKNADDAIISRFPIKCDHFDRSSPI